MFAENGSHSHMTFCVVEKVSDAVFMLKPLKQKQMVDGLCYLLQEIYGIENKYAQWSKVRPCHDNNNNNLYTAFRKKRVSRLLV